MTPNGNGEPQLHFARLMYELNAATGVGVLGIGPATGVSLCCKDPGQRMPITVSFLPIELSGVQHCQASTEWSSF